MRLRGRLAWVTVTSAIGITVGATWLIATPYVRAATLLARAAGLGGRIEQVAHATARAVTVLPPGHVPTRQGNVPAQIYRSSGRVTRAALLVPGVHAMGITEPRVSALADDLAGSGLTVMTMALPDLTAYRITARSADVIEDAVAWMARQADLAPDGRVGLMGVSFAGGLSLVAAGRPSIRDKLAYIVSLGGHGDLQRVIDYLTTGQVPQVSGAASLPPHDYGLAVVAYAAADRLVEADQAEPLREGIRRFLLASQHTLVDADEAETMFRDAREFGAALPEPSATYLSYVNERNVNALGTLLTAHVHDAADPAASPERASSWPAAPVFLLHGDSDNVIPAAESVLLGNVLRARGVKTRVLLTPLITHAELSRPVTLADSWDLIALWADVLQR